MLPGVTSNLNTRVITLIHKRLSNAQSSDRLENCESIVDPPRRRYAADADIAHGSGPLHSQRYRTCHSHLEFWSNRPVCGYSCSEYARWFHVRTRVAHMVYAPQLCFQTSVRCLSCHELADDATTVDRLRVLYDKLDTSTTPASVLLPWLPSPSMVTKLHASKKVYDIVDGAIRARIESGISRDDTLQMLIDSGDDKLIIVGVSSSSKSNALKGTHRFHSSSWVCSWPAHGLPVQLAGPSELQVISILISQPLSASWLVTFLAEDVERRQKARDEIRALLSMHAYYAGNAKESIAELLSAIPLEAWEKSTPVLDKFIRETLRIAQPHAAMRRNMGPDTYVDGTCIPSGAYVVYPFSDVHLNPQLYADPWRFDPDRTQVEGKYNYVGWGGGK